MFICDVVFVYACRRCLQGCTTEYNACVCADGPAGPGDCSGRAGSGSEADGAGGSEEAAGTGGPAWRTVLLVQEHCSPAQLHPYSYSDAELSTFRSEGERAKHFSCNLLLGAYFLQMIHLIQLQSKYNVVNGYMCRLTLQDFQYKHILYVVYLKTKAVVS